MKNLFLVLLFVPLVSFGQTYSNYYGTLDVNQNINANVNVNKNVDVSGSVNVDKTITSIDYGALRLANAQIEKNRLERQIYANEEQKRVALEIATNPLKAFDYGTDNNFVMDKKYAESLGFSKGSVYYIKVPNKALFVSTGGYNFRNESEDGIVTEIEFDRVNYVLGTTSYLELKKEDRKKRLKIMQPYFGNTEEYVKYQIKNQNIVVGKVTKDGNFTHKVDINKAKIFGREGFVFSWFYENDYEYVIKDNYRLITANGFLVEAGVRFRGDKDEIDFEMLEGRRDYLQRLCKQIIATAGIKLGKKGVNK